MKLKNLLSIFIALAVSTVMMNAQQIDPQSVKCYLKFDDNIDNSSTSGTTFSEAFGTISYETGKFGNAGSFSDLALISSGINFNPVNGFSVTAWVKVSQLGVAHTIVHQQDKDGDAPGRIHMEVVDWNAFGSFTDGIRCDAEGTSVSTDTWYHCAVVKDADLGKTYIYVDGLLIKEIDAGTESNTGEIVVGGRKQLNGDAPLTGSLDELLLTSEVLSAEKITYIMNNGVQAALNATAIDEVSALTVDNYYSNGQLNLSFGQSITGAKYSVYSVSGKCVLQGDIESNSNSCVVPANLKNGLYILTVTSDKGTVSDKFIVK